MKKTISLSLGMIVCVAVASADWKQGVALTQNGQFAEARPHFQELTNSQPGYAGSWYMLAVCDERLGEDALARVALVEALSIDPTQQSWRLMLAGIDSRTGRADEAMTQLEMIDPTTLEPRIQRRFVEILDSLEGVDRVLQLGDPLMSSSDAGVLARLAELAIGQGEFEQGVDLLERAFASAPDARIGQRMVTVGQRTGDLQRVAQLAAVLASTIQDPEYDLLEGESWLEAGELDRALACFARQSLQGRSEIELYRAQVLRPSGDWSASEGILRAALSKHPEEEIEDRILRELGYVLVKQERRPEAVEAYRRAGDEESAALVQQAIEEDERIAREQENYERMKELADQLAQLENGLSEEDAAKLAKKRKER